MTDFGLDAVIEFTDKAIEHRVVPGDFRGAKCYIEQIDIMPPNDFLGSMKVIASAYGDHFARTFGEGAPVATFSEKIIDNRSSYVCSLRCYSLEGSPSAVSVIFPLDQAAHLLKVDKSGFSPRFSIGDTITLRAGILNLVEYPASQVRTAISARIVALSARKELHQLSSCRVWKAVLLTERSRYLSVLRYNGSLVLEQYVPLVYLRFGEDEVRTFEEGVRLDDSCRFVHL